MPGWLRAPGLCAGALSTAALWSSLLFTNVPVTGLPFSPVAQAQEPPTRPPDDPAQDILIEGLGFSKLILAVSAHEEPGGADPAAGSRFRPALQLIEKNLCWSGLFNLWRGVTRHCALGSEPSRIDMVLQLTRRDRVLAARLKDAGPEGVVLYEENLELAESVAEQAVMELVNRLSQRLTGKPGLLGSTIAFVLRQPSYAKVIVSVNTHGDQLLLLSRNREINLLPRWSPDGMALLYTMLSNQGSAVYLEDLSGEPARAASSRFLTPHGGLNSGGAFSPDGKRVALTMSPDNNADLYEVELETRTTRQLTSRQGIETQADWSPDGKRIVFVSDRTGTPQVYLLELETGEELRLTFEGTYNADPRWSPDGKSILFTRREDNRDQVYIMDAYGERLRPVTRGRFDAEQATWSPDGHQIVFSSNRTGDFKLYVVSADGSNLRRLTRTPALFEESSPTWTLRRNIPRP
ncbi:MAG: PD40 domain-containing protein [Candidatus Lambdaproteobacteria bacterium]|nr:PD40 domain-containing protein [Candidatus Lambdaproteobacteria bacterium]